MTNLSDDELERIAIFALGLAIGFIVFTLTVSLVEEWVIASDRADRRRIHDVIREMFGSIGQDGGQEMREEEQEKRWAATIVSTPRPSLTQSTE